MNLPRSSAEKNIRRAGRGFALPMTILAISGLMLMLIGLLSILTLERKTARSYSNATRADMALQSGLADAIATIAPIASRDDTLVFRIDDPSTTADTSTKQKFFTYGAQYDTGKKNWRILPFVSGLKEITAGAKTPDTTSIATALKNFTAKELTRQRDNDPPIPQAAWVDLDNNDSPYDMRYAWWVEDLSGRLDGRNAGADPRLLGLGPTETGLFTIFNDKADKDAGVGPKDKLVAQRNNLRSSASTRLVLDKVDADKIEPYITYSLPKQFKSKPLIPQGFDYKNAGEPAKDLNELIAQKNVDEIASHITYNLPLFTTRKGGFPAGEDYVKTLAASMIDYADSDSDPTLGTGYRGVDSYPFVNELFDRYEWTGTANGQVTIQVTTFVELWNLTQLTITGSFELENVNLHEIKIPPAAATKFSPVVHPAQQVSIPANGFIVRNCGVKSYGFPVGVFPPSTLEFPNETKTSSYRLRWNGKLIDWARGNVTRTTGTLLAGPSKAKWKGHASPALDYSIGQQGDPRASYYINTSIFPNNYDQNSNWGGRGLKPTISNPNYAEVKVSRWSDRGSDSKPGTVPGSDSKLPTSLALPPTQSAMAPGFISNKNLVSLAEIGNIFDPAQWANVESTAADPSKDAGGGFTLAVGRPEYAKFDKDGMRAAQLLDLFTIKDSAATKDICKVNVNTAPREVLRTLVAGQLLSNDLVNATYYPAKDFSIGDRFADAVIASRNKAPLRGLSDLAMVRKNPSEARNYATPNRDTEPFFGSRVQYPGTTSPPDTWDDAGREELFQRVCNLVTFRGKTFRIIVAGEAVDKSGVVIGRRTREFHIQIDSPRDADGAVIAGKPLIIKTLYEKTL